MSELKACPFCGGKAELLPGCKTVVRCSAGCADNVNLAAWNHRADDAGRLRSAVISGRDSVRLLDMKQALEHRNEMDDRVFLLRVIDDLFASLPASPSEEPKQTGLRWCANSECDSNKDEGCGNFCSRHWALLPDAARKIEADKKPAPAKEDEKR